MTTNFIHRILRSLHGSLQPISTTRPHAVDNQPTLLVPVPKQERRIDTRFAVKTPCLYELGTEQPQGTPAISGKAHSLNVSSGGVLLLLDQHPQAGQLLTIHNPALEPQRGISLFEVRWTTQLPLNVSQPCYLVGCHLAFGRFPYFLVQRQHLDRDLSSLSR